MNKTEKFWNRLSKGSKPSDAPLNNESIQTVDMTAKYLNTSDTVLDFGCGSGSLTIELSKHVKEMYGIDISSVAIENAVTNAGIKKAENVSFKHITIDDEQLESKSFNTVLAYNILLHLPDLSSTIRRVQELLKSEGLFISSTATLGEKRTFMAFILKLLVKIGVAPKMNFFAGNELEQLIIEAGFEIVECIRVSEKFNEKFIVARKL